MYTLQRLFPIFAILFFIIAGCQKSGNSISEGDTFEITEEMWHKGNMRSSEGDEESFVCVLPKGTIMKATQKSDPVNQFFSAEPISIDNESDQVIIESRLVSQNIRSRPDYSGYYFSFSKDLLGNKLKRIEK